VLLGPTPDLVLAQQTLVNAIHAMLFQWPVGAALTYSQLTVRINASVPEVIDNVFAAPSPFTTTPPTAVGGDVGQKVMPGAIVVTVNRA